MKYTLEVPDSYHRKIAERASQEGISARALLVWWIKTRIDDDEARRAARGESSPLNEPTAA